MYTFYHMLSFILFIVPIFLMYLLPCLSPITSSCSFRLCTAGYQKGVGKNTPCGWGFSKSALLCVHYPTLMCSAGGACWEELRDPWVCQCLNCGFSSTSGRMRSEQGGHSSVSPLPALLDSGGMELAVPHHTGLPHCKDQRKWSLRSQL